MSEAGDFETAFLAAGRQHREGKLADAERAYESLAGRHSGKNRERVLRALVNLHLQRGQSQKAADTLETLSNELPDNPGYYWDLANLLLSMGKPDAALDHFRRLLTRHPQSASVHHNFAMLQKRALRYADALDAYRAALDLGIDNAEEVYSNMGVIYADMRDAGRARDMYRRALEINDRYLPALFNLGILAEESGDRQQAADTYARILELDPEHWDALARLAEVSQPESADDPLIDRLRRAIDKADGQSIAKESLTYALGRNLDAVGSYEDAWSAYTAANALGGRRHTPYRRAETAQGFDQLIAFFNADWIREHSTNLTASPIFICGMFRSGSTLIEQMLGAHADITSGGELDFLPWLIGRDLSPYPQQVGQVGAAELSAIGEEYLARTRELFPDAAHLTDKRPDNFLHLGLLKAMFPQSRFVYTKRDCIDNCLSIFFQQIGGNLAYATDLGNAADYYRQHERLMRHWMDNFGDDIFTVSYDELVVSPEAQVRALLSFLGLGWDENCLAFNEAGGLVKTASLWQVRQGLHSSSSGRWKNYRAFVPELETLCGKSDGPG